MDGRRQNAPQMGAQQKLRPWHLSMIAATVFAACDQLTSVVATEPPITDERHPVPGTLYLTALPEAATVELVIRFVSGGDPSSVETVVPEGVPVLVERTLGSGPHELEVNGVVCDGTYPIEKGMETDAVVIFGDDGCRVETRQIHAENAAVHGETTGVVYGSAGVGSVVRLRPIAGGGVERSMDSDPDGWFRFFDLLAGTYELTVEVDGQVTITRTIQLKALEEVYLELVQLGE